MLEIKSSIIIYGGRKQLVISLPGYNKQDLMIGFDRFNNKVVIRTVKGYKETLININPPFLSDYNIQLAENTLVDTNEPITSMDGVFLVPLKTQIELEDLWS